VRVRHRDRQVARGLHHRVVESLDHVALHELAGGRRESGWTSFRLDRFPT
jgi:hypothetical protein